MTLARLHSIQVVREVIPTSGSEPLKVLCSDMYWYVVKYPSPDSRGLFREYLAHEFLKCWDIPTPEAAIVMIREDDISDDLLASRRNRINLAMPCFGSRWLANAEELKPSFVEKSRSTLAHYDREDFLRIALFDLWLANEDRTENNPNLLISAPNDGFFRFVAIDHVNIFNSGRTSGPIAELTLEDSLLSSHYQKELFPWSKKMKGETEEILGEFPYFVGLCASAFPEILETSPPEWRIETEEFALWASDNLFSEERLNKVVYNFRDLLTRAYQP